MKLSTHHRSARRWFSLGLPLLAVMAAQAQTQVTFTIDMSTETTAPSAVYISGSFNGWPYQSAATALTNNPTGATPNIWSQTFTYSDAPGTVESCKFQDDVTGWEPISNNRQFVLGTGTQVLPLTTWGSSYPAPTNQVTFQVDLSAQVALGNFTPGSGTITVSGDFEGWDNGLAMTNNPALSGSASNVYSGIFPVQGFPPTTVNYKFRLNGGWESPASTSGNNRQSTITNSTQVLPLVYYNDNSIHDLVLAPTTVTFALYMPNGTLDKNGYAFNNTSDTLWINGDFVNWNGNSWPGPVGSFPAAQQMIEVGLSDVYTNSFVIPAGNSIYLNYKYSIDSSDDENGFGTNHVREIRSYGPTYTMPQDVWSWSVLQPGNGNPYPLAGIASTNIVEPDFGYLGVGALVGGKFPITWLGRPGVVLQNNSSLTAGSWNDNTGTDGTQATNWPNAGNNQFFRLKKSQ